MKKAIVLFVLFICGISLCCLPSRPAGQSTSASCISRSLACHTVEEAMKLMPELEKLDKAVRNLCLGIVSHNLAASGQHGCLAKALDSLSQACQQNPSPLATGYYGSALTLQAGDEFQQGNMPSAMQHLQEGIRLLDEGVASAPQEVALHILRLENSFALAQNSPLNRDDQIREDLAFFKAILEKLPVNLRAYYYLQEARFNKKNNNMELVIPFLEKAMQAAPSSSYAQQAQEELARLKK